jgi:hypothetical protein
MSETPKTDSHASSDPTFAGGQAVSARFARTLERENNELRATFPKILQALESGFCTDDCSIEAGVEPPYTPQELSQAIEFAIRTMVMVYGEGRNEGKN